MALPVHELKKRLNISIISYMEEHEYADSIQEFEVESEVPIPDLLENDVPNNLLTQFWAGFLDQFLIVDAPDNGPLPNEHNIRSLRLNIWNYLSFFNYQKTAPVFKREAEIDEAWEIRIARSDLRLRWSELWSFAQNVVQNQAMNDRWVAYASAPNWANLEPLPEASQDPANIPSVNRLAFEELNDSDPLIQLPVEPQQAEPVQPEQPQQAEPVQPELHPSASEKLKRKRSE